MKLERMLSNGAWVAEDDADSIEIYLDSAIDTESVIASNRNREPEFTDREGAMNALCSGKELCTGPDWYAKIRDKEAIDRITAERRAKAKPQRKVYCDCGHVCEAGLVMTASLGTACSPECYDNLSE